MKLLLIRHGESTYNHYNRSHPEQKILTGQFETPLTERGREQARALRSDKRLQTVDYLYSSPLSRAFETAKLATARPDIRQDPRLMERSLGDYEGLTAAEVQERFQQTIDPEELKHTFVKRAPGGESYADVEQRIRAFLADLPRDAGSIALFGHVCCLRLCVKVCLGISEEATLSYSIPNARPLELQDIQLENLQNVREM